MKDFMRRCLELGCAGLLMLVLGAGALAQGLPEMVSAPATSLPLPTGAGEIFGTAAKTDPVGAGDLLDVRVFGQPQLSGDLRVGADGSIAPPFIRDLRVGGETPGQIETALSAEYGRLLLHPLVSVRVAENNSRRIAVNGAVPRPGVYRFSGQLTLLEALAMAGGVDPVKASQTIFLLHRPPAQASHNARGTPTFTVNEALETIDLRRVEQDPGLNRRLAPGDVIDVPEAHLVYISGDVLHPGAEPLLPGLTLTQLISEAGGFLPQANTGQVQLLRREANGASRRLLVLDVSGMQHNRRADMPLEADDIVQVQGSLLRMTGLELLDFFTGTERWRVQQSVANKVP
ncbi:MAG: SLBB domain-containing protein [Terriglobales bacterium]